jgi:hypothetical protein
LTNQIPQNARQHHEAVSVLGTGNDLDGDAEGVLRPGGELLASIGVVGPDQDDFGVLGMQPGEQNTGGGALLDVGRGDQQIDQKAVLVNN